MYEEYVYPDPGETTLAAANSRLVPKFGQLIQTGYETKCPSMCVNKKRHYAKKVRPTLVGKQARGSFYSSVLYIYNYITTRGIGGQGGVRG